jgi:hypothetical protein
MENFNVQVSQQDNKVIAVVSGYVNEYAKFPALPEADYVIIDLGAVKGLNSVGTRSWCAWLKDIKHTTKIVIEKAPVIYVKSFNQVKHSYPDNAQILSFVVPYFSDANDERKDVIFKFNENFNNNGPTTLPKVVDSKGVEMEMDVIPEAYFAFLERV